MIKWIKENVLALIVIGFLIVAGLWIYNIQNDSRQTEARLLNEARAKNVLAQDLADAKERLAEFEAKAKEEEIAARILNEKIDMFRKIQGKMYVYPNGGELPDMKWIDATTSGEFRLPVTVDPEGKDSVLLGNRNHPRYDIYPEEGYEWVHITNPADAGAFYRAVEETHCLWGTRKIQNTVNSGGVVHRTPEVSSTEKVYEYEEIPILSAEAVDEIIEDSEEETTVF